jgi:uncharacterized protein YpmS
MKKSKKPAIIFLILLAAALACNFPTDSGSGSRAESTRTPENMVDAWQNAYDDYVETGVLTLTLTEGQLTEFLNDQLALQPEPLISDARVRLRNGEMIVTGDYAVSGAITTEAEVIMEVVVDDSGNPRIEVTSGSVGIIPIPQEILDTISFTVNEMLTGQAASLASGFQLTGMEISDGALSISGTVQE